MRITLAAVTVAALLVSASSALAQITGIGRAIDRATEAKDKLDSLTFNDQEEQQIGSEISVKLRNQYGVVQDPAVHKYVTLVGTTLAKESTRPSLRWTFIVLDTDGVNAFAAPGGFIHITKGALALIQNEAELADVLGHEIGHVTEKHTINAIRKSNIASELAKATRKEVLTAVAERGYAMILENNWDRGDETASDRIGITLANKAGWAPTGLAAFLTRLSERNKDLKERSGVFASHPEAKARLSELSKTISSAKLSAAALVAPRYAQAITYKPVPVTAVPQGDAPATASAAKPASGGGKLGMGNLSSLGRERDSSVSSAGSRGVNPDRDAKGGPNKTLVSVSVSTAELAAFRKGITG
jgi:predicted Zn-dependent protease